MATGQYRSAFSFDDVAQKSILAGSTLQNNSERTSKPLEEQCDEFVPLVSLRFQGVKTIDVIERNRPPKNSVALEPGDLEVDFVCVFPTLLRAIFPFFLGGRGEGGVATLTVHWHTSPEWPQDGSRWCRDHLVKTIKNPRESQCFWLSVHLILQDDTMIAQHGLKKASRWPQDGQDSFAMAF